MSEQWLREQEKYREINREGGRDETIKVGRTSSIPGGGGEYTQKVFEMSHNNKKRRRESSQTYQKVGRVTSEGEVMTEIKQRGDWEVLTDSRQREEECTGLTRHVIQQYLNAWRADR